MAEMVTQYLLALKRRVEGQHIEFVLENPVFQRAMQDVQSKLRDGTAQWHSYDEVFRD